MRAAARQIEAGRGAGGAARRMLAAAALGALALAGGASGCSADRPFIATRGADLGSLYARGELTDVHGNEWNVRPLPGVVNAAEHVGDGLRDAGEIAAHLGRTDFYEDTFELSGDLIEGGYRLGVERCIGGIPQAMSDNGKAIGDLARETPFGWVLRIGGRVVWGYAIEPVGRLALGATVAVGGTVAGIATPPVAIGGCPVVAAGDLAIMGVARPAFEVAITQPVYVCAILNREPSVERDADGWLVELKAQAQPGEAEGGAAADAEAEAGALAAEASAARQ